MLLSTWFNFGKLWTLFFELTFRFFILHQIWIFRRTRIYFNLYWFSDLLYRVDSLLFLHWNWRSFLIEMISFPTYFGCNLSWLPFSCIFACSNFFFDIIYNLFSDLSFISHNVFRILLFCRNTWRSSINFSINFILIQ